MSYRQPRYVAPADANETIEKFNESMKNFADTVKAQDQQQWCRENPGACKDDDREDKKIESGQDTKVDKKAKGTSLAQQVVNQQTKSNHSPLQQMSNKTVDPAKEAWEQNLLEEDRLENLKG